MAKTERVGVYTSKWRRLTVTRLTDVNIRVRVCCERTLPSASRLTSTLQGQGLNCTVYFNHYSRPLRGLLEYQLDRLHPTSTPTTPFEHISIAVARTSILLSTTSTEKLNISRIHCGLVIENRVYAWKTLHRCTAKHRKRIE
jgi:hypothetical protein